MTPQDGIENTIAKYVEKSAHQRALMQNRLFTIFTETTGYRPEDICLVEEQIKTGLEIKTIYYFDLKIRHQTIRHPE